MTSTFRDGSTAPWPSARDAAGTPAVLPWGAYEQHGAHLPLATDTIMACGLARRVAESIGGWLLPAVPYGETSTNGKFPGTLSLAFDTVRSIAVDIALGAARTGFSCLVVVNGDYGNQAPLRAAAKHVNSTMGFKILVVDYPGLAEIAIDVLDTPAAGPGIYHADELETSMVLALEPGSVEMGLAAAYYPDVPPTFGSTPIGFDELSPSGVLGDPTAATAAKGERLLELLTERAVALATNFVGGLPAR